jgi:hypothetical protein
MNKIYKAMMIVAASLSSLTIKAQLAGTYSVPATYSTIAAAIQDLNTQGVGGPVTILIDAAYTEVAPSGGFSLTATGTSTSPIVFQKNGIGANPAITSYTGGTGTPSSAFQDGVWRFIGCDYVTIDGIDIVEQNSTNPATMEFGYGFFKASSSDGCQNNTVRNCVITLDRINNAFGSAPAADGSRGIDVVNALSSSHNFNVTVSAASGANSNNSFYSNTIQNCNIGISMIGYAAPSPFTLADQNNDIGGSNVSTGNTIINYGGAVSSSYPADAVRTQAQYFLNVSYNLINSNNGSGVSHSNLLRGIYVNTAQSANTSINNNTITLSSSAGFYQQIPIYNTSGSTAASNTVSINNNLIANCTYSNATSLTLYRIYNSGAPAVLSISNNTLMNNSTSMTSGTWYNIYNIGAATTSANISGNLLDLGNFSALSTSAYMYGVYNSSGVNTTIYSCSSNTLQNANFTGTCTGYCYLLYNSGTQGRTNVTSNNYNNLSINSNYYVYMLYNCPTSPSINISGNYVNGSFSKNYAGGAVYGFYNGCGTTGTATLSNNNISNVNLAGSTMYGMYSLASSVQTLAVTNNTISNINTGNGTMYGMYVYYPINFSGNLVSNITAGSTAYGIYMPSSTNPALSVNSNTISSITSTGSTVYGMYAAPGSTMSLFRNKIYNLQTAYSFGSVYGLYIGGGVYNRIYNNYIGDIRTPNANSTNAMTGLYVTGGTRNDIFYNTVFLNATSNGPTFGSSAIYTSISYSVCLRNNIFVNLSIPVGTGSTVAYRRSSSSLTTYSSTSNNNIFYAGTPGNNNLIFSDGINNFQTLASFTTFVSPREANSQTENTPFLSVVGTSPSFLHVNPAAPSLAESGAVNIAGITDDYDADIRQGNIGYVGTGTAPDIGADEFESNVVNCNLVTGGSVTPTSTNMCTGGLTTLNGSGYSAGYGITYQWQVSNSPGGPYVNVVGGNGANYPQAYTTPTLGNNSYYYVLLTTCTISGAFAVSQEATVSVLGYPSLTVTPANSTICVPGGSSVTLVASGANSYTWGPAAGLSGTVGVSVDAFPVSTTMYTLTGTNLAGCTSTTGAVVNIAENPAINSASANPTLICVGGNSSLQVNGATTSSYVVSAIAYSPVPTPTTGVTTLANNGLQVTPLSVGSLDDGAWYNIPIPFSFNFFGTTYNSFAISTNGFLSLGGGVPYTYTGYSNTFPSSFAGRPCIGPLYADLNWATQGTVETFTVGVAPYRKLIVNYTNGYYWCCGGTITAQSIIYETTNVIESHVTDNTANSNASEVIQNASGTTAFWAPLRNNSIWAVNTPDAYRWTPAGPVSYTWSPATFLNATNIPDPIAGNVNASVNYSVTVTTPMGCSASTVLSIVSEPNPTVSITGTNALCSGTVINLNAAGASTYSWSTGANTSSIAVSPGTSTVYSVVGTSSMGCTDSASKAITVYATPTVNVAGSSTVCSGNFITLSATGANTYSWSNGSTLSVIVPAPTITTQYTVIGTSTAGCSSANVRTISTVALPSVTITSLPNDTICLRENINLVASGGGADTYSWSTGSTSPFITASPSVSTTYSIYVYSNVTGCSNFDDIRITVNPCTGLEENSSKLAGLSLYPNPNKGEFTISLDNGFEKKYEVSDVTGRIILKGIFENDQTKVKLDQLAKGLYYVRIESKGAQEVLKVIVQ